MLHIITGAPCAGKTTYVREHRSAGDITIDLDALASALGAPEEHGATGAIKDAAIRARDAAIGYAMETGAEAWVIHTAPTPEQMEAYMAAGAETIDLDPGMEECLDRAERDGRPQGTADLIREHYGKAKGKEMEEHKHRDFYVKEVGVDEESGEHYVIGYAATFHREPDSYGDIIRKGAFEGSLARWAETGAPIPLLFGHRMDDPMLNIGAITQAGEDEVGLLVKGVFDMENERGAYSWKLAKEGRIRKFSFAYDVLDAGPVELEDGRQVNELRELEIFEVSLVPVPANQHAEILEVKEQEPATKEWSADGGAAEEQAEAKGTPEEPEHAKAGIEALIARIDIETID